MSKNFFESLPFGQKMQLYLLIPILYGLVFIVFGNISNYYQKQQKQINSPKSMIKTLNLTKDMRTLEAVKVVEFLEKQTKQYLIKIQTIQTKQKLFFLEVTGDLDNLKAFLQKIQLHFEILSFKFTQNKKLNLTINTQYFFNQKAIKREFYVKQKKIGSQYINDAIKLEAIIDKEVLIDGNWLKIGDSYKACKILAIDKKQVKFFDLETKKEFTVELFNESL